jgi:hypothetical protein
MPKQVPTIGRIVIHKGILSNGVNVHPAVVTRVWPEQDGRQLLNLHVMTDFGPTQPAGSQCIYESEADGDAAGEAWFCFWPPRV